MLRIEVFRSTVASKELVGTYAALSNQGGVVHPETPSVELDEISSILQIPLVAGTVNRGSPLIGAGVVVNDWSAFCGMDTTSTEITVLESVYKIGDHVPSYIANKMRESLIDRYVHFAIDTSVIFNLQFCAYYCNNTYNIIKDYQSSPASD